MCSYEWLDHDETIFETEEIEATDDPEFDYKAEHIVEITEELCNHMMFNTLGINVYGMIESKRQKQQEEGSYYSQSVSSDDEEDAEVNKFQSNTYEKRRSIALNRSNTSVSTKKRLQTQEELIAELEEENLKL